MHEHDEQEKVGTGTGLARRAVMKALVAAPVAALAASVPTAVMRAADDADAEFIGPRDYAGPRWQTRIVIKDWSEATPFSSSVSVPKLKGRIRDVNVILEGVTHDRPEDIAVMLTFANRNVTLMRGAGGEFGIREANIVLSSQAGPVLPQTGPILGNQAYRPSDYSGGLGFGQDAPVPNDVPVGDPPARRYLTLFNGLDAHDGPWVLWVRDDAETFSGSMRSWRLEIVTDEYDGLVSLDRYTTLEGRTLRVARRDGVLRNVTDPIGSGYSLTIEKKPTKGRLKLQDDGSFTYTPKSKRTGKDYFIFQAVTSSGSSIEGPGRVNITIKKKKKKKNKKKNK